MSLPNRFRLGSARASIEEAAAGLLRLGVWGVADQALLSATNFVTLVFVARNVGPREFGSYSLALTLVLFVMSFQTALLNKPFVVISVARRGDSYREYVTSVLWAQLGFGAVVNLLVLPLALLAYLLGYGEAAALLAVTGPVIAAWGLQEYLRQVLYVERRLKAARVNDAVSYGGQLIAVLAAAVAGVLTPVLAFGIIALTSFAATAVGLLQLRRSLSGRLDREALRRDGVENWHFGRWMIGAAMLLGTVDLAYVWLVAGFVSVAAAGALRAITGVLGPTHVLLKTMDNTLTPMAARVSQREGVTGVKRLLGKIFLISGPPMLGWLLFVSAFPGRLLGFLYGVEYAPYAWLLPAGALSYALGYANKVVSIALVVRRLPQAIFRGQLLQAAFFWSFGLGATYFFGLGGAAITMVGSALVQSIELWRWYLRDVRSAERTVVPESAGLRTASEAGGSL